MWIDTRNYEPIADDVYLTQTVYGDITAMSYTLEGGWNTHRTLSGELSAESAMNDGYIVRWHEHEEPPTVPEEWKDEYRKGVSK